MLLRVELSTNVIFEVGFIAIITRGFDHGFWPWFEDGGGACVHCAERMMRLADEAV